VQVLESPDAAIFGALLASCTPGRARGDRHGRGRRDHVDDSTTRREGRRRGLLGILPDDAVFLGTDATERWTGKQFREFAMPYFKRGPRDPRAAVALDHAVGRRRVLAWFDEVLDNEGCANAAARACCALPLESWSITEKPSPRSHRAVARAPMPTHGAGAERSDAESSMHPRSPTGAPATTT
jgi:hypothetical protein